MSGGGGKGAYRNPDLDFSSRVPANQLGHVEIGGVTYPLKDLGAWAANYTANDSSTHPQSYHAGNFVTYSGNTYLCISPSAVTSLPTSGDWMLFDEKTHFLRADRVWARAAGPGGDWITVGTPTQVAGLVDPYGTLLTDLIAANPAPFNVSPWVPYADPWNYSGGLDAPVAFMLDSSGFTVLRGAAAGGARTTAVFVLPVGFRPFYQQELVVPVGNNEFIATAVVGTDGSVVWIDTI